MSMISYIHEENRMDDLGIFSDLQLYSMQGGFKKSCHA